MSRTRATRRTQDAIFYDRVHLYGCCPLAIVLEAAAANFPVGRRRLAGSRSAPRLRILP